MSITYKNDAEEKFNFNNLYGILNGISWNYADGSNMYTNADGTWKYILDENGNPTEEKYSASWMTTKFPSTFYHTFSAEECTSWDPYVLSFELGINGESYTGTYDVFVRTSSNANLYGFKFDVYPPQNGLEWMLADDNEHGTRSGDEKACTANSGEKAKSWKDETVYKYVDLGSDGVETISIDLAQGENADRYISFAIVPHGAEAPTSYTTRIVGVDVMCKWDPRLLHTLFLMVKHIARGCTMYM